MESKKNIFLSVTFISGIYATRKIGPKGFEFVAYNKVRKVSYFVRTIL